MKKMKALQIIAAAMAVTVAATSAPVNAFCIWRDKCKQHIIYRYTEYFRLYHLERYRLE